MKLIRVESENIQILYNWIMKEENPHLFTCQPVEKFQESYEEYKNLKQKLYESQQSFEMLAFQTNRNSPIGKVSCFNINNRNMSAEIGYYLPAEHRGKGYGLEILVQFIPFLFSNNGFNKVYATTSSNNTASIKILENASFSLDGRNREHYWIEGNRFDQLIYSLLQREWSGNRNP